MTKKFKDGMRAIHPGEFLAEILRELKITQSEFARTIGVARMRISLILSGQRPVSAEMALLIGKAFNQTPGYWMGLQADYDLKLAEKAVGARLKKVQPVFAAA